MRVVKAQRHVLPSGDDIFIETFKAADDAAGVVKIYQAKAPVSFTDGTWLEWFCLVGDDGSNSTPFDHHHLGNYFGHSPLINQISIVKNLIEQCELTYEAICTINRQEFN